jgi:DNA-binding NarL/FixJ family response regulator
MDINYKIRILLADDHLLVRAGIKTLLHNIKNVEVIAEASNGREAIKMIEEHKPDLVLLDIAMAELNGLEVTERVAKEHPDVLIIILSMHMNEEYVLQALRTGASGYLLKDSAPNELEIAITAVMKGERYLSPAISKNLVDDYLRRINGEVKRSEKESVFDLLTPRQREILQLIAEGNSTKEIANKLHVSVKTIETHRAQLMERLDIRDVAGLVRYAIRTGLIAYER